MCKKILWLFVAVAILYCSPLWLVPIAQSEAESDNPWNDVLQYTFNGGTEPQGSAGVINPNNFPVTADTHITCVTPPAGMVAWWPGDNTPDDIVSANNGIWQGTEAYTAGTVGRAFSFATELDFVKVSDPANGSLDFGTTGSFSIDAWIKTTSPGTATIVDKRGGTQANPTGYVLSVLNGKLAFQLSPGFFPGNNVGVHLPINNGNWHHVAVTVNRAVGGGNLYVDCVNVLNFSTAAGNISNTADLRIGQRQAFSTAVAFAGAIDELEIFNRELDSTEIQAIWNAGSAGKCKPRNHFKTWRSHYLFTPPVTRFVFIQDQFDTASVRLDDIDFLSNPARKVVPNDTFNIIKSNDHLAWYRAKTVAPIHDKTFEVKYENQIETTIVRIDTLKYLLVPTQKFPHPRPDTLLGHYTAYRIQAPCMVRGKQVQITDQFDSIPEIIDSLLPTYFLTPAIKNNEPRFDPDTHYVAYRIFPERVGAQFRQFQDQFDSYFMQMDTSKFLLVPTKKISVIIPSPPDTLRNHFKTWRIQPLPTDIGVVVRDQFRPDSISIALVSIDFLSNPAKKIVPNDTFNITRPNDHLTWYRAEGPVTKINVTYKNQFESTSVFIDTLKYLLVPTQKHPHLSPDSLLGHYTAYRIKALQSLLRNVQIEDQFDRGAESINGLTPAYFLTPATKNGEPRFDPDTHYVAYEINPKQDTDTLTSMTTDQFGMHHMIIVRSELLLVPTRKIAFTFCTFKPGDFNGNGTINLTDIVGLVNHVFKGAPVPVPKCRGDANASNTINLTDVIYLVNFVFKSGPAPMPSGVCCIP